MSDLEKEIDEALVCEKPVPRDAVLAWIRAARNDLRVLAKLYQLTGECYYRIDPELGADETCALIQRYLLECVRQNVTDDDVIEDRWEAARTLHAWFCHLGEMNDTSDVIERATKAITDVFLNSDEDIRSAIEQGFLEHVLEMKSLRPFFEYWSSDPRLQPAWSRAMEWAKEHPEYMWNLLRRFSKRPD